MPTLTVHAPDGVPEIRPGDDLSAVVLAALGEWGLEDGDVVVVTSKVVSKAEGRMEYGDRETWIDAETVRVVARRGATRIVRNRLGLTMAAAGVDGSNVDAGAVLLLPLDPDGTARSLRAAIATATGANVGVVITDTAGRPWREGQTDIAIGAAGVQVLESFAGRTDAHGNELAVTAPAVADEIASATELAQGKLGGRPVAVVRGLAAHVRPAGDDGPGAGSVIRADGGDFFGYGAREAVTRAVIGDPRDQRPFGAPAAVEELIAVLAQAGVGAQASGADAVQLEEPLPAQGAILVFAHGWVADPDTNLRLRPACP